MGSFAQASTQQKMSLKYLRRNLIFISNQSKDTTIITTDGEHIKTQRHLLSTASPYLAALISQTDHIEWIAISVPFSSKVVRNVLDNLGSEDEDCSEIESEGFDAAKELGIMFLNKAQTKRRENDIKGFENDAVSVEEYPNIVALDKFDDNTNDELKTEETCSSEVNPNKKAEAKKSKKIKGTLVKKDRSKEHRCNACDLEFKHFSHLSDHDKKLHPGLKRFLCDHCGKGFSRAGDRDHHITTVHSDAKPFLCDHCGKGFRSAGNKNCHIESVHSEGPGFQCPYCEKSFKHLSIHIKHFHTVGGEKFTCEECGKIFRTKNYLSKHMRYHLPDEAKRAIMEKNQCKDCGIGFINSTRLKRHENKHNGIKSFYCQHCPKSFFRNDHLKTHVNNTHKM